MKYVINIPSNRLNGVLKLKTSVTNQGKYMICVKYKFN